MGSFSRNYTIMMCQ